MKKTPHIFIKQTKLDSYFWFSFCFVVFSIPDIVKDYIQTAKKFNFS